MPRPSGALDELAKLMPDTAERLDGEGNTTDVPVFELSEGDRVVGGTVNGDGSLRIRVTATGEDTAIAGIMRLVEEARESKSEHPIGRAIRRRADVGIAMGSGTDVAVESAGIVLVRSRPDDVPKVFRLSRASRWKMIQNLWWAAGYNIVALPLAAGAMARWGVLLSPAVGALLMSLSTVIVALNAQLLRGRSLAEN